MTYILAVSTCFADQVSLAFVFLKYVITDSFNYPMAPGPARGRGDVDGDVAPSLLSSLRRGPRLRPERRSTLCTAVPPVQSLLSLTNIVNGAATTEEGWRRRHSSPGHKTGTLTLFDTDISGRSVSFNAQEKRLPEERARAPPRGDGCTGRVELDGDVAEVSARSSTVT